MANIKTNPMRILENLNINYNSMSYDNRDGENRWNISCRENWKKNPEVVF